MAQNNMRKMFTEQQIVDLAKANISGGTKLYFHTYHDESNTKEISFISTENTRLSSNQLVLGFYHGKVFHLMYYNDNDIDVVSMVFRIEDNNNTLEILTTSYDLGDTAGSLDFDDLSSFDITPL